MSAASYIEVLTQYFPNVGATAVGSAFEYNDLLHVNGDPIPPKSELDPYLIKVLQNNKWKEIQQYRDQRKVLGTLVGTKWFNSDDFSRIQQLGLVMMGANMPSGIMWKTMDGTFILMTPQLAQQIFFAVASQDMTIFGIAEHHRQVMMTSEHPDVYDFSQGWPKVYGE
jgi:hypothetical protein